MGGFEALPFGLLIFVAGTLLIANAWAVLDARITAGSAAREAARAYVESTSGSADAARAEAVRAATEVMVGQGRDPARMTVSSVGPLRFERCAPATFQVGYRVPTLHLPWIGGFGTGFVTVTGRHGELVDPFRDGVPFAGDRTSVVC